MWDFVARVTIIEWWKLNYRLRFMHEFDNGLEVMRMCARYHSYSTRCGLEHVVPTFIDDTAADKNDLRQFIGRGQFADRVEKNDSGVGVAWIRSFGSSSPTQP